jgi:hypothetical protein
VDGSNVVRAASHRLRERSRNRARAQSVTERLARPEVRGERHRREELGQTQRAGQLTRIRADHREERYPARSASGVSGERQRGVLAECSR